MHRGRPSMYMTHSSTTIVSPIRLGVMIVRPRQQRGKGRHLGQCLQIHSASSSTRYVGCAFKNALANAASLASSRAWASLAIESSVGEHCDRVCNMFNVWAVSEEHSLIEMSVLTAGIELGMDPMLKPFWTPGLNGSGISVSESDDPELFVSAVPKKPESAGGGATQSGIVVRSGLPARSPVTSDAGGSAIILGRFARKRASQKSMFKKSRTSGLRYFWLWAATIWTGKGQYCSCLVL